MSGASAYVDLLVVDGLDDIDIEGLERRIALLDELAPGTVHTGTEGVGSNGHNVGSEETGLRGMVFHNSDSVSTYLYAQRGMDANLSFQMPADKALKDAILEGEAGIRGMTSIWNDVLRNAERVKPSMDHVLVHDAVALVRTIVLHANPEFPLWGKLELTFPTWATGAKVKFEGKEILSTAAAGIIGDAMPKAVKVSRGTGSHLMLLTGHQFKVEETPSAIDAMRTMARIELDGSTPLLRKAGMEAGR